MKNKEGKMEMVAMMICMIILRSSALICNGYVNSEGLELVCQGNSCVLNGMMDFSPQVNGRTVCAVVRERNGGDDSVIIGVKRISSWTNTDLFREFYTSEWIGVLERRKICNGVDGCLGTCCSSCMRDNFITRAPLVSGENDFYAMSSNIFCAYGCTSYGRGSTCSGCSPSSGSCLYTEWFPRPVSPFAEIFINTPVLESKDYSDYEIVIIDNQGNIREEYLDSENSITFENFAAREYGSVTRSNVFAGKKLILREDGQLAMDSDVVLSKGHSGDLLFRREGDGSIIRTDITYDREICNLIQTADDAFINCYQSGLSNLFYQGSTPANNWGNPFVYNDEICEVFYNPNRFPTGTVATVHCTRETNYRTGIQFQVENQNYERIVPEEENCIEVDIGDVTGCWACMSGVKVWIRMRTCTGGMVQLSSTNSVVSTPVLNSTKDTENYVLTFFVEENNMVAIISMRIGDKETVLNVPVDLYQFEPYDNGTHNYYNNSFETNIYGFTSIESDGLSMGEIIGIVIGSVSFFVMFSTSTAFFVLSQKNQRESLLN